MELDIKTLTQEQKKQLDLGYNIYLNENNKLVIEDPTVITDEFVEYKTEQINKIFQNSINRLNKIDLTEELEAKKFKDTGVSEFITDMLIIGETESELATKIQNDAKVYKKAYALAKKIQRQALKDLIT